MEHNIESNLENWARRDAAGEHNDYHKNPNPHGKIVDDYLYYPQLSGMPGLPETPVYPPHTCDKRDKCNKEKEPHCDCGRRGHRGSGQMPVKGHQYGTMNPNAKLVKTGPTYLVKWGDNSDSTSSSIQSSVNSKRTVTLVFYRNQLIYDIANVSWLEGDILPENLQPLRSHIQDICAEGNIDRVARMIELAFASCVEQLYPYTKEEISTFSKYEDIDNRPTEPELYEMTLSLPRNFSATTVNLLAKLINEYMVCAVLSDWLGILNPSMSEKWLGKSAIMMDKIKKSMSMRMGVVRRRISPFQ